MIEKSMTVTYEVDSGLYINMTNRCSNACTFCIRNNGNGAYGSDSLWLEHEPTVDEVLASIFSRDLEKYSEVVFCGYGEPTYRLQDARAIALKIKERYPNMCIRINTNGQANLIHKRDVSDVIVTSCDVINISLNECNAKKYQTHCKSIFGEKAFDALLEFATLCLQKGGKVVFSVVDSIGYADIEACKKLAQKVGVPLRVRAKE